MARTTPELVAGIIEVDSVSIPDLTPFIDVANAIVTEVCVPEEYDDTRLELIERWLSAHVYALRDPRTSSESAGVRLPTNSTYGMNFQGTSYGQMALLLDTKGGLAALSKRTENGKKAIVGVTYLGTSDDTEEDDA
jgi:hypothetical protein